MVRSEWGLGRGTGRYLMLQLVYPTHIARISRLPQLVLQLNFAPITNNQGATYTHPVDTIA